MSKRILGLFRNFFRKRAVEQALDDELRSAVEVLTQEKMKNGVSRSVARREALIELGGVEQVKEQTREVRAGHFLETLWQDVRYGARMLCKSPGFTVVAVLTLALGIGANTAIFSLVDSLLLRPLPVSQPGKIAFLFSTSKNAGTNTRFSHPDFLEIQKQTSSIFTDASALLPFNMDGLSLGAKSQPMWTSYVSGNFFSLLGVKPALGRLILPAEGSVVGADPVVVISYSYWKSRFNSDPSLIGKRASVNGHPVTIIGVTPQGFHGLSNLIDTQGYIPLAMASAFKDAPSNFLSDEKDSGFTVISRLKPNVSFVQAQPVLQVVAQRLPEQGRGQRSLHAVYLGPDGFTIDRTNTGILTVVSSLFLILAATLLILACLNIANLCLARAAARRHEVAMRAALGATRGRLIRQLLTESLLLAILGCLGGIVLGIAAARSMGSISFHSVLPIVLDFRFDWRVFTYTLAAAVFTGILVGIAPALRAARGSLNEILHEGSRTSATARHRLRSTLVVAQVGSSLMLLIVAGLFVRSLEKARHADLGFDPNHVLNVTVDSHEGGYNETQAREFQETLLDRARSLPGVQSASLAASVPMATGGGSGYARLKIDGYQPPKDQENPGVAYNAISSSYFGTMHIPLLRGREIQNSDTENSQRVAVIDQTMAERYWRGRDPIGRHFSTKNDPGHPMEVIGIARNAVEDDILSADEPFFYVPLTQNYDPVVTLQLRTSSAPETIAPEVLGMVRSLDPAMPVFDVMSMNTGLETFNGLLLFSFAAAIASALGLIGLTLAIVGVYGVVSYSAGQRTHEIGIRMALGAQPSQILKMVLSQGFVIVAIGVLAGILSAAALARLVSNFLFGIAAFDPLTYISASLLLAAIALLACYLPARRAMRVDPMIALRHE
ncbi:MAG TPA: ABC transporter permease [Candidatus Sulfotelmatobacter sp.]|nr:ABC transporter permease [Candidatus Sulfotelmatobacter sp.]